MKNILFVASECVPFIKTGGLADVVGSLPKYFPKEYFDVRVVIPKYAGIKEQFRNQMQYVTNFYMDLNWRQQYVGIFEMEYEGIKFYFIDNEEYGLYHVVCPGSCSRYEFARTILEYTGKTGDLDLYPVVARDDVRPTYSVLDNMMLRLTGIPEPPDWKTALKEYLEETGGIE